MHPSVCVYSFPFSLDFSLLCAKALSPSPSVKAKSFSNSFHTSTHPPIRACVFHSIFLHLRRLQKLSLPTPNIPILCLGVERERNQVFVQKLNILLVSFAGLQLYAEQRIMSVLFIRRMQHSHFCLDIQSQLHTATYLTVVQRECALTLSHTFHPP